MNHPDSPFAIVWLLTTFFLIVIFFFFETNEMQRHVIWIIFVTIFKILIFVSSIIILFILLIKTNFLKKCWKIFKKIWLFFYFLIIQPVIEFLYFMLYIFYFKLYLIFFYIFSNNETKKFIKYLKEYEEYLIENLWKYTTVKINKWIWNNKIKNIFIEIKNENNILDFAIEDNKKINKMLFDFTNEEISFFKNKINKFKIIKKKIQFKNNEIKNNPFIKLLIAKIIFKNIKNKILNTNKFKELNKLSNSLQTLTNEKNNDLNIINKINKNFSFLEKILQ